MATREGIREGIIEEIKRWKSSVPYVQADAIIDYLHSKGVVIKVDRELPNFTSSEYRDFQDGINLLIDEGYVAVESL